MLAIPPTAAVASVSITQALCIFISTLIVITALYIFISTLIVITLYVAPQIYDTRRNTLVGLGRLKKREGYVGGDAFIDKMARKKCKK